MTIKRIFKCTIPSCSYYFKSGVQAAFLNGKYITENADQIAELEVEVGVPGFGKSKHPHIYVDLDEAEIDTEALSPLEEIKRQAVADYLAAQKVAMNPANDRGASDTTKFVASLNNTAGIAQAATGGSDSPNEGVSIAPSAEVTGVTAVTADLAAKMAKLIPSK